MMFPLAVGALVALAFLAVFVFAVPRWERLDERLWRWAYGRYLRSAAWRTTRFLRLWQDNLDCRHCRWPADPPEVHHLRYRRWWWYLAAGALGGSEDPDDLVTLCRRCHAEEHGR